MLPFLDSASRITRLMPLMKPPPLQLTFAWNIAASPCKSQPQRILMSVFAYRSSFRGIVVIWIKKQ